MYLRITSKHPKEEVERLVRFAAEPYDLRRVCVNVKNSQFTFRGRAYSQVPRQYSNAPRTAKHLVVICVGAAEKFKREKPIDNIRWTFRWVRVKEGESYNPSDVRGCMKMVNGVQEHWLEREVKTEAPYSGKKSPVIEYHTWQEAMVAVAAHEFHHIHQFQNKLRCAERYCERAALEALERYRATLT